MCVCVSVFYSIVISEKKENKNTNRKQNHETLYKCEIRRFSSDLLWGSSDISIGGDVSALAEFTEKLSHCLPLHPFCPSLIPDSSSCDLAS